MFKIEFKAALTQNIKKLFEDGLDLLFPKSEIVRELEEMSAEMFVLQAGAPLPIEKADTFALFSYKSDFAKEAIHQLKYSKNARIASMLGKILDQKLRTITAGNLSWIIIPAPIHPKKRRKRGYNQIEFLLQMLPTAQNSSAWHVEKNILEKIIHTTAQSELEGRQERLVNISSECFRVKDPQILAHKRIVLIDDVYTTGTTMDAMKSALILTGAEHVTCICLAH